MHKFKGILLPLALVFAAIAIFETGARYGAANTRAVALTGQLSNYVALYRQVAQQADQRSLANLELVIDNHIVTAALQRGAWYLRLRDEPVGQLNQALGSALLLRGDAVKQRFAAMHADAESAAQISDAQLAQIMTALDMARADLIKTTPDP
jgi:hypothetical protein